MKLLPIFLVLVLCIGLPAFAQKDTQLKPDEFESKSKESNIQLVDVRTADEFGKGHISGAKNIDFNSPDFDKNSKGLKKDQPVMVYCLSGVRSAKAATMLRKQGYEVYELKGGLAEWKSKRKPLTKADKR